MTKAKQRAIAEAKQRLIEAIGITPRQAARYIKAAKASDAVGSAARQEWLCEMDMVNAARDAAGRDLTTDEYRAISQQVSRQYTAEDKARISADLQRAEKAIAKKREIIVICRHVSSSGMSRRLSLHISRGDRMLTLGYNAAIATGNRYHDRNNAVVVQGCGMDMGFALVYELSHALYGDGYVLTHRWL